MLEGRAFIWGQGFTLSLAIFGAGAASLAQGEVGVQGASLPQRSFQLGADPVLDAVVFSVVEGFNRGRTAIAEEVVKLKEERGALREEGGA